MDPKEDKTQEALNDIRVRWIGADYEENGDWDDRGGIGVEAYGELLISIELEYIPTGETWIDTYTASAKGTPINFTYSPARISSWPGEPAEIDWDSIDWYDVDFDHIDWKETKGKIPEVISYETYEKLWEKLEELIHKYEDDLFEEKVIEIN